MFRRTRYQQGSLNLEERKKGPAVWVYRWWERDIDGKSIRRKSQVGDASEYPTESVAQAAADALRLTINDHSQRNSLRRTTVNTLWEHYTSEELSLKEVSTQDVYRCFVKNWILPRWGRLLLHEVKTVEVERWLRATDLADGTKAKIKNIMSALFSHAVRWEFCGHNPISSGIQVGTGGKRGPSVGVRISAKRQREHRWSCPRNRSNRAWPSCSSGTSFWCFLSEHSVRAEERLEHYAGRIAISPTKPSMSSTPTIGGEEDT